MTRLRRHCRNFALLCIAFAITSTCLSARAEDPAQIVAETTAPLNFPTATMGGVQFWSDELVFRGWRIQQNALTGHYRLLDEHDFRMAWGTFDQCRDRLDELKREHDLAPLKGRAVVTLHGLGRSRDAMAMLGKETTAGTDATWINVSYASSRRSLDDHAQSLARVLSHLDGIEQIDFVCHSLGNLVVRRYLGEASLAEPRWKTDPRIKRMVMLGPPNNGAQLARLFKDNKLFGLVTGPSGKQLALPQGDVQKQLATPTFEFGIIAGSCGELSQSNPVVAGDDDLIVAVEETRLAGASDFLIVPTWHATMLRDEHVCQCAARFLKEGYFVAADKRVPISEAKNGERVSEKGERGASAP
ncbi:MAG: alpha/beta hydrolase [Planctomycetaceae bacterium]|nr:alpha/beta hydrolase [Planctomycetaceae bacterium]